MDCPPGTVFVCVSRESEAIGRLKIRDPARRNRRAGGKGFQHKMVTILQLDFENNHVNMKICLGDGLKYRRGKAV